MNIADIEKMSTPVPLTGCWLWTGTWNGNGYGRVRVAGRNKYPHRLAAEAVYGPIPEGMLVCHKCDTRCCVNPDHLYIGTVSDNSMDMVARGRHPLHTKSTCKKGHPLPDRVPGARQRVCRVCANESGRKYLRSRRSKAAA